MDFSLFSDPIVLGCVLVMPVVIIALAKTWKRFKDQRAAKEGKVAGGESPAQAPASTSSSDQS